jgi:hypothetical protein
VDSIGALLASGKLYRIVNDRDIFAQITHEE